MRIVPRDGGAFSPVVAHIPLHGQSLMRGDELPSVIRRAGVFST
jgi:hypothetical protein